MGPMLADAALTEPEAILLIILCCVSMILALYAVIFMVPVKRFIARLEKLGVSMQWLNEAVSSLRDETREQVEEAEGRLETRIAELQSNVEGMGAESGALRAAREQDAQRLAELGAALDRAREAVRHVESEFAVARREIESGVGELCDDRARKVRADVLSTLDALRDEILHQTRSNLRLQPMPPRPATTYRQGPTGARPNITQLPLKPQEETPPDDEDGAAPPRK